MNYEIKRSAGTFAGILLYGILCPAGNLIVFLKIVYDNAKKAMRGMFPAILTIVLYSFLISGGYFNTKVEGVWATIVFALLLIVYEKFGNVLVCNWNGREENS